MGNFWVFEQGLPLIRGKSQKPNSWFFMVIPIYSWLLVAIHGYKKLSGSCENMEKKNIAISCHCVYLEVFFNFSISIFKFWPIEGTIWSKIYEIKNHQIVRARLRRNHKALVQNPVTKLLLFLKSHLWLFVVIRGYSYHKWVVIPDSSYPPPPSNAWHGAKKKVRFIQGTPANFYHAV